jgi:hypothetical protein
MIEKCQQPSRTLDAAKQPVDHLYLNYCTIKEQLVSVFTSRQVSAYFIAKMEPDKYIEYHLGFGKRRQLLSHDIQVRHLKQQLYIAANVYLLAKQHGLQAAMLWKLGNGE